MHDIFLSYAREDRERVRPLVEQLEEHGWSVWWDRKIPMGREWSEVIEEAIEDSRTMVVVWTEASVSSDWVRTEAREGKARPGGLIPVRLDAVNIRLEFKGLQDADLTDWDGSASHPELQATLLALESILGVPSPTVEQEETPAERPVDTPGADAVAPISETPPALDDSKEAAGHTVTLEDEPRIEREEDTGREPLYTLKHTWEGQNATIQALAFSQDGRLLASAGSARKEWYNPGQTDGTIKLWNVATGELRNTLAQKGDAQYNSIAFSPDGRSLASGDEPPSNAADGTVKTWNLETGTLTRILATAKVGQVLNVAFTSDDRLFAIARVRSEDGRGDDGWFKLLDPATGAIADAVDADRASYGTLDGRWLASLGSGEELSVWDPVTGRALVQELALDFRWKPPLAITADGRFLAVVNSSARTSWWIMLVDLASGDVKTALEVEREPTVLAFSPDGQFLFANAKYATISIWDAASGEPVGQLGGKRIGQIVTALAFSQDGRLLAWSTYENGELWPRVKYTISVYERGPN